MIGCIGVLLLHVGVAVPVLPQVAVPAFIETSLPDAPVAKPEIHPRVSSYVAGQDSQAETSSVAVDSEAQNSQTLSTIRLPEAPAARAPRVIPAMSPLSRRSWLTLLIAQHGAAGFDAYSTRRAIGAGAVETNPFMRPFAHSPAIYAAIQVGPTLLDFAGRRMQRSQNGLLRRTWWLPQSASTGLFIASGVHNLRITKKP